MPFDGPLQRLDARVKLVAAVAFVVGVVAAPSGSWRLLGAMAACLAVAAAVGRISPARLLVRWLGFAIVVGFLAVLASGAVAERTGLPRRLVVLDLVVRNSLAFGAMMILAEVTPWSRLLSALRRLGVPAVLTATIAMMHRYLFVLRDELDRMATARRARTFGRSGLTFSVLAGLIGMLLFRALLREERVFDAMTARGWDGEFRTLDD
ncbi:energy-coupling factor transporter transmembrane component T family protein [Paludisphaera rhizosphaerae]|uniref:energy-coupling factor transporter transmembrane component T family protein n=1 Tax=Paludisphaera rhizosphaerae TaxID=2711216 RepID=UPI0013EAA359|nr:energy-coupling factor transporter transmembrane component T [Paludisphaera rhizosphaerae]